MYGDNLIAIISAAEQTPAREIPVYPRMKAPVVHPATPDRIKVLKNWRKNEGFMRRLGYRLPKKKN